MRYTKTNVIIFWMVWLLVGLPIMPWAATLAGRVERSYNIDASNMSVTAVLFVPGEQRQFAFTLKDDGSTMTLYPDYHTSSGQFITYDQDGVKLTSMSLTYSVSETSGTLLGTLGQTTISSATYYGVILIRSSTESVTIVTPPFLIQLGASLENIYGE